MTIACYQGMLNAVDISLFEVQMEITEITDKELLRGPSGGQTQIELQGAVNGRDDFHAFDSGDIGIGDHARAGGATVEAGGITFAPTNGPYAAPPGIVIGLPETITFPDGRVTRNNGFPPGTTANPSWRVFNRQTQQWVNAGDPSMAGSGQNVRFDRRRGCFVDSQGNIVFQEINVPGQGTRFISGRMVALPRQDAINEIKQKDQVEKREELQDKLRMNKLNTKLEMLNKQREKIMQWLTKAIEAWFKGPGDRN